jgi:hypothetical protein
MREQLVYFIVCVELETQHWFPVDSAAETNHAKFNLVRSENDFPVASK